MIKRRSTGTLVALFGILALCWALAGFTTRLPAEVALQPLVITDSVAAGVHTYAGIIASARCPLGVTVSAAGVDAAHVRLVLAENRAGSCDSAGQPFAASVESAAPVLDSVTLDGKAIPVTLITR